MLSTRYKNNGKASLHLNDFQRKEVDIVKKKIQEGAYKFEAKPCAICGEIHDLETLSEKDRYGFYFPMQICQSCGFVFANPQMREKDYTDFYVNSHQKRVYVGKDRPGNAYFKTQMRKGASIYNYISKNIPEDKKLHVLEVGCGAGGILKVFKERGHEVKGVDLNPVYVTYGSMEHGLNLSTQNLFDIKNEKYDLIIYSHVLEHLSKPSEHLQFVKELLHPEGMVYIEVPGIKESVKNYGDFLRYLQNAHIYNFSHTSLTNLMAKNGYKAMGSPNEFIRSLWKIGEKPLTKFDNDYANCMRYLTANESILRRKAYSIKNYIIKQYVTLKRSILNK